MGGMSDLALRRGKSYPEIPGATNNTTSKESAVSMTSTASKLRDRVLAALRTREMTADEVAISIDVTPFSVRPRITELSALGKIEATTRRRFNASGHRAIVWRIKP